MTPTTPAAMRRTAIPAIAALLLATLATVPVASADHLFNTDYTTAGNDNYGTWTCPLGYNNEAFVNVCVVDCGFVNSQPNGCYGHYDRECTPVLGSAVCVPSDLQPEPNECYHNRPGDQPVAYGVCKTLYVEAYCGEDLSGSRGGCWCWTGPTALHPLAMVFICSSVFQP